MAVIIKIIILLVLIYVALDAVSTCSYNRGYRDGVTEMYRRTMKILQKDDDTQGKEVKQDGSTDIGTGNDDLLLQGHRKGTGVDVGQDGDDKARQALQE